jgi:Icc-related predicted phosphoesterase
MRVAFTADLHGELPYIPPCDLLVIAGDVCRIRNHSIASQTEFLNGDFADWMSDLLSTDVGEIAWVAGNHDFALEADPALGYNLPGVFLRDDALNYGGLRIWGTPWVPRFGRWAFMAEEDVLAGLYGMIPTALDILITHGPPMGTLDLTARSPRDNVGSTALAARLKAIKPPRVHVFGHIHEGQGLSLGVETLSINASHVDLQYAPTTAPIVLDME